MNQVARGEMSSSSYSKREAFPNIAFQSQPPCPANLGVIPNFATPAHTFHSFSKLSTEIRLKIWDATIETPRIIRLDGIDGGGDRPSMAIYACREAASHLRSKYTVFDNLIEQKKHNPTTASRLFVCPETDIIYMETTTQYMQNDTFLLELPKNINIQWLAKVKNVVLQLKSQHGTKGLPLHSDERSDVPLQHIVTFTSLDLLFWGGRAPLLNNIYVMLDDVQHLQAHRFVPVNVPTRHEATFMSIFREMLRDIKDSEYKALIDDSEMKWNASTKVHFIRSDATQD